MLRSKSFANIIPALVRVTGFIQSVQAQLTKIDVGYRAISGGAVPAWLA